MCTVKGRITPEHRLRATPYKVICVIDEENEEIIDARCEDCPASEGKQMYLYYLSFFTES